MTTPPLNWQEILLLLVGFYLGLLGSLYLAYDLSGRSEKLYRSAWVFSSGFLLASLILVSYLFLIGPDHLASGYLSREVWRFVALFTTVTLVLQNATFLSVPSIPLPDIAWSRLILWMILYGSEFVGSAVVMVPQSLLTIVLFALPGIFIYGTLNGFSPTIHWWVLHLPEKCVAVIGTLLICGAFALASVLPLLGLLGIPF